MKIKIGILLIISYLIAFVINFLPSMKYPDANINLVNLLATILLLGVLIIFTNKMRGTKRSPKLLRIFYIFGIIAGVLVLVLKMLEDYTLKYAILDIIASIQYPLYVFFTTPFFGANMLFNVNYATFAVFTSLFYMLMLVLMGIVGNNKVKSSI
ncbi:hypothetical protein [Virgibacillus ndiopensis]|uniref:hypothetical protein n=1 Tax=Virgibacillus ndiopensis TaxID=2004408 RepID=UPI000C06A6AA|nr:hypothetical protein [Virgibacillus ndiopensis]